ncbi:MAG TPA: S24 family peptidase [Nevskiaceae bacterium]|nr:S24 family peptidase [Nevskiaceae bacterium]
MPTVRDYRRANLASLIAQAGTQARLADQTGLARAFVSQVMIRNRELGDRAARQIERRMGLPHGALDLPAMTSPVMEVREPAAHYGDAAAPARIAQACGARAGQGKTRKVEWLTDPVAATPWKQELPAQLGLRAERCISLTAVSDNMEPAIRKGDQLLIDISSGTVRDGGIHVVVTGDRIELLRLRRQRGGMILAQSDHPDQSRYPPRLLDAARSAIAGRVVWRQGAL